MKMFNPKDKVVVLHDDARPELKGKKGEVIIQTTEISPFWCTVKVEGKSYPIRGTSLKKLTL